MDFIEFDGECRGDLRVESRRIEQVLWEFKGESVVQNLWRNLY